MSSRLKDKRLTPSDLPPFIRPRFDPLDRRRRIWRVSCTSSLWIEDAQPSRPGWSRALHTSGFPTDLEGW